MSLSILPSSLWEAVGPFFVWPPPTPTVGLLLRLGA